MSSQVVLAAIAAVEATGQAATAAAVHAHLDEKFPGLPQPFVEQQLHRLVAEGYAQQPATGAFTVLPKIAPKKTPTKVAMKKQAEGKKKAAGKKKGATPNGNFDVLYETLQNSLQQGMAGAPNPKLLDALDELEKWREKDDTGQPSDPAFWGMWLLGGRLERDGLTIQSPPGAARCITSMRDFIVIPRKPEYKLLRTAITKFQDLAFGKYNSREAGQADRKAIRTESKILPYALRRGLPPELFLWFAKRQKGPKVPRYSPPNTLPGLPAALLSEEDALVAKELDMSIDPANTLLLPPYHKPTELLAAALRVQPLSLPRPLPLPPAKQKQKAKKSAKSTRSRLPPPQNPRKKKGEGASVATAAALPVPASPLPDAELPPLPPLTPAPAVPAPPFTADEALTSAVAMMFQPLPSPPPFGCQTPPLEWPRNDSEEDTPDSPMCEPYTAEYGAPIAVPSYNSPLRSGDLMPSSLQPEPDPLEMPFGLELALLPPFSLVTQPAELRAHDAGL